MGSLRRPGVASEASLRNREQVARLGRELRESRRRLGMTQTRLGQRADLSQSAVSLAERGFGGSLSLDTWQRLFVGVHRRLLLDASRDANQETIDAGHLAMQELVLGLLRSARYRTSIELPTRTANPQRSVDVVARDDRRRRLLLVECWNTFGDVGAALRSTDRKAAEAESLATAWWGEAVHSVHTVWVVRDTTRNRSLVRRYPGVFAARFPGSSERWVRALTEAGAPPFERGLVWCDRLIRGVFAWRRRLLASAGPH